MGPDVGTEVSSGEVSLAMARVEWLGAEDLGLNPHSSELLIVCNYRQIMSLSVP